MVDLDEVRKEDIDKGAFDIYTDDIDFSDEEYTELRLKNIVRISQINPVDVDNPAIFEHLKKVTAYIKDIADTILPEGYSVLNNTIMAYVKVILNAVRKDSSCLEKVSEAQFKSNYLLEAILLRDVIARFNKFQLENKNAQPSDESGKFYLEYERLEEIINRKKYAKKVFSNNIVMKKVAGESSKTKDLKNLSNDDLLSEIED